jgi:uncharacterized RDD family membrane protein YckC
MSAPTPAPGDDRPREGYYPDPSIPGYVRYWNGAAWVPGTSRPAPTDGLPIAAPPGAGPSVEETGPHFFDEDPEQQANPVTPAEAQHGSRPEPASAWGADRSRQTGFGGDPDRRVSWGAPQGTDPRAANDAPAQPDGHVAGTDGTAAVPPTDPESQSPGTFVFRRPNTGGSDTSRPTPPTPDEGTVTFRALSPRTGHQDGAPGAHPGGAGTPDGNGGAGRGVADGAAGAGGFGAQGVRGTGSAAGGSGAAGLGAQGPMGPGSSAGDPGAGSGRQGSAGTAAAAGFGGQDGAAPSGPGFGAGKAAAARAAAAQAQPGVGAPASAAAPTALSGPQQPAPAVPQQPGPPQQAAASVPTPMATGAGGGQPSWAQQVHRLAGADEGPVAPWKPPVEDVFTAAARRQSAARPAGLGRRLVARLVDTVVLAGVTAVAAVPLGTKALDHINEKIDAAKLSGRTETVWLLDGTTSVYLGVVLAVLLLFGVLYEALPTAKWGRTLGKKVCGLEVRGIESHEPPAFGAALRRWLVYSVPGLLGIGVIGVAWCLFDRPWRQCWHDKAAHTFVAA